MLSLFHIFLFDRAAVKFACGVVFGMAFSMAVILSTLGIMEGFRETLGQGLRKFSGDVSVGRGGAFFSPPTEELADFGVEAFSPVAQMQGFVVAAGSEISRGVLIKGVDADDFKKSSGIHLDLAENRMAVGKVLARELALSAGDEIVAAFAAGGGGSLPVLRRFVVSTIVEHGLHQKDARQVYISLESMQRILGLGNKVNLLSLRLPASHGEDVGKFAQELGSSLGEDWAVSPYWSEYGILFRAVGEQKRVIVIVLALIVLVSIFNILAFVIFLREKRVREIFLFRSLGMSGRALARCWLGLIGLLWIAAVLLSVGLTNIFEWALGHLSLFYLPGDIYHFSRLHLALGSFDYAGVFGAVFVWLMILSWVLIRPGRETFVLSGLRREFS